MSRRRSAFARTVWCGAELLVTAGVLALLLVVHQLWWTNQQARSGAERTVRALERDWGRGAPGPVPGGASPSGSPAAVPTAEDSSRPPAVPDDRAAPPRPLAYALLRIPSLRLTVPVAPGVGRRDVLDKGFAGHYPGTAPPGRTGNFALAGHRNSHGEPFRDLDRLRPGDHVLVETRDAVHTYAVDAVIPRTSPRDVGVIAAVPRSLVHPGSGYERPGRYLTLTTCAPPLRSTHRLVVWAVLIHSKDVRWGQDR
ncbi:class E sortase [Streptomyces coeruleoprunus]|uniref:Class E sortase n=1 Tax=Streptomyces coeruleoprunus TaxID=285563 RepID=A0ABV9XPS5_9ACTN